MWIIDDEKARDFITSLVDENFIDIDNYTIGNEWKLNDDDDILAFRPLNVEPPKMEDLL